LEEEEEGDMEIEGITLAKQAAGAKAEENEEDWEDEKDAGDGDLVNVEFDFSDPHPSQEASIRNLVTCLLDGQSYNAADLAKIIVNQVVVGTMISVADEEDGGKPTEESKIERPKSQTQVFGFATLLNINTYRVTINR
jgi:hypothetical protein